MNNSLCNSINNCESGAYCSECSHGIHFGKGYDRNGKLWEWEFNPRFGPSFLTKKGEFKKNQPIDENDPCWFPFEVWHEMFLRIKKPIKETTND